MKILSLLCREGKYDDAAESLGELIQYFDRHEPKSHYLYYEAGQLFSRVVRRVNILIIFCEAQVSFILKVAG